LPIVIIIIIHPVKPASVLTWF